MNLKSGSLISKGLLERLKSGRNRLDLTDAEREYLSLLLSTEYHEWYPYSKVGPGKDMVCLVTVERTDEPGRRYIALDWYDADYERFDSLHEEPYAKVVAWTEVPAPYKEASDEQS